MSSIASLRGLLLAVLLLGSGCGSVAEPTPAGDDAPADAAGDTAAEAIVSLSPSSTEILYAIGAGDRVVAVDRHSNHPAGTPTTELSGFDPNVEAIADLGPDLVVVSGDRNEIVAGLGALGIPVVVHPSAVSVDDAIEQILALGRHTGQGVAAEQLAEDIETRLAALAASAPEQAEGLTFYLELADGHVTATSSTFVGQLYDLLGLTNIADAAPQAGDGGGFPRLAPEYVIEADPDLVFVAHPTDVGARPGWDQMTAVRNGHVVDLDTDIASRWGPRIVEHVEAVLDAVEARLDTVAE